jgi:hypothetical protein
MSALPLPLARESELSERWASPGGPLRLEDGRSLRVVFPGVPGGGAGPDFRGAILDAGGDLLRGDVEVHLRASGWESHGHGRDPAYHGVVLHVVAVNDGGGVATRHGGRAIPIVVLPLGDAGFPPPFSPPCTFARGEEATETLARLGRRRLRAKAAAVQPAVVTSGPAGALAALLLETLGGSANRPAFASLGRTLPLAVLLERADESGAPRPLAITAELKGVAARFVLRRAGLRPMASPGRRLDAAGTLFARLWPTREAAWPFAPGESLLPRLKAPGIGRSMAVELAVNAALPVALASGAWTEDAAFAAWEALPSPGTYGHVRRLEGWLGGRDARPFASAARLQGGLLLHRDYCTAGRCGRCPLS